MITAKLYNLEERTLEFGKRIIRLANALGKNQINKVLISQIVRSGISLGANYREANETETKEGFPIGSESAEKRQRKLYIGCALL
jgi:four helix bundle protein